MAELIKFADVPWAVSPAGAVNAVVTAQKAGVAGRKHGVVAIYAGYTGGAATGLLTVKDGAAVLMQVPVVNAGVIELPMPLFAGDGNVLQVDLAAGGAGITGYVTLVGITR